MTKKYYPWFQNFDMKEPQYQSKFVDPFLKLDDTKNLIAFWSTFSIVVATGIVEVVS